MILNILEIIFVALLFVQVVLLIVTVYNYFTAPQINKQKLKPYHDPMISILIPARNEENNIENSLRSIFNSTYKNYEVKVLDDFSTDSTASKVKEYQKSNKNLEFIHGEELPDGWVGKNWACNQLAVKAQGEYLLFLDADVIISPTAIQSVVIEFQNKKVQMLSVFPTQKMMSLGEWLIIPLMDWLLLTFLPLCKVYKSANPSFAAANGQFILFDKKSYFNFGGHKNIKDKIVEDMEFVRGFKKMGLKTITFLGNNFVNCRMYHNFDAALNGYTKNFYPGFNIKGVTFVLLILFFLFLFILPFFLIFCSPLFLIILGIIFFERTLTSLLSRQSLLKNIILFLPQMFMLIFIGTKSLIDNNRKKVIWKGRNIR